MYISLCILSTQCTFRLVLPICTSIFRLSKLWFPLQRELKLNLEDFVNRVVNVSFAVATPRGLSMYSPATIVRVPGGKPHAQLNA